MEFAPDIEGLSHATKDDLVAENRKLLARITELEQLAKEMAEALQAVHDGKFLVQLSGPLNRYREVCGGEK